MKTENPPILTFPHKGGRKYLYVNGERAQSEKHYELPSENSKIVFESLRSYGGIIFRLKEHLKRLSESARTIDLTLPKSVTHLEAELKSCLSQSLKKDAFLRISVDEYNSYILVTERKRPTWIYEKGLRLKTVVMRKNMPNAIPSEIKTNAFLTNVLATLESGEEDIDEAILLDPNGFITESTVWNLFLIKEGIVFTAATGILHGVTRQFVIECAESENLPIKESYLTRHDLWNAHEAFLTNTSGEIVPIQSLDGRKIGMRIPGLITKRLMASFQKRLFMELSNQAN